MTSSDSAHSPSLSVATFSAAMKNWEQWLPQGDPDATIWYLGSDYTRLVALQQKFRAQFAPVAEKVNEAAQSLLPLFLDLDGALAGNGFNRDAWNASDLGERSRFNSPFLLETARVVAFLRSSGKGRQFA